MVFTYLTLIIVRTISVPYFNKDVYRFVVYNELYLLIFSIFGVNMAFLDKSKSLSNIVYVFILMIGSFYAFSKYN